MAGLLGVLNVAREGILSSQVGTQTTASNVANAATAGYARRRVDFRSTTGGGVMVGSVERAFDRFASKRLWQQDGLRGEASTLAAATSRIERVVDGDGSGVGQAIDAFFQSLRGLSSQPGDLGRRREVAARVEGLADSFRRTAGSLDGLRDELDTEIDASVESLNAKLSELAALNEQVASARTSGIDAGAAADRRDVLARELGEVVGARIEVADDGSYKVMAGRDVVLVEGGQAARVEAGTSATGARTITVAPSRGLRVEITNRLEGGKLAGQLSARDGLVGTALDELDRLAFDLATMVNTQHAAGVGLDGGTGRALFDVPGTAAGTARTISAAAWVQTDPGWVAAALDPAGLPGDNQNVLAMIDLESTSLSSFGSDPGSAFAAMIERVGRESAEASRALSLHESATTQLESLKDQVSGVSVDEEMTQLVQYQRSFQASVRVLQTVDSLLETLLRA